APICEEIIFRGILFQKLKEIMPLFLSIIIQGFIFGIVHGSFIQSLLAGFSGILYALVYNYKKNLTLPILIHAFNNIFLIILNLLFPNL
ncbi:MAG: lysostaphin resistance A-like protein, partial [Clostridium sp.]